jgi:hypothetical protein
VTFRLLPRDYDGTCILKILRWSDPSYEWDGEAAAVEAEDFYRLGLALHRIHPEWERHLVCRPAFGSPPAGRAPNPRPADRRSALTLY